MSGPSRIAQAQAAVLMDELAPAIERMIARQLDIGAARRTDAENELLERVAGQLVQALDRMDMAKFSSGEPAARVALVKRARALKAVMDGIAARRRAAR